MYGMPAPATIGTTVSGLLSNPSSTTTTLSSTIWFAHVLDDSGVPSSLQGSIWITWPAMPPSWSFAYCARAWTTTRASGWLIAWPPSKLSHPTFTGVPVAFVPVAWAPVVGVVEPGGDAAGLLLLEHAAASMVRTRQPTNKCRRMGPSWENSRMVKGRRDLWRFARRSGAAGRRRVPLPRGRAHRSHRGTSHRGGDSPTPR